MTLQEQLQYGLLGAKSSKYQGVKDDKPRKHEESTLHATFCKWLHKEYPELQFVRHEREKKRSWFMQMLFKVLNSDIDKLPDFELLQNGRGINGYSCGLPVYTIFCGLYIEFKKPGEKWLLRDGKTVKPEYANQYKFHIFAWTIGRPTYFCNDLEDAKRIVVAYLAGTPLPKQEYDLPSV